MIKLIHVQLKVIWLSFNETKFNYIFFLNFCSPLHKNRFHFKFIEILMFNEKPSDKKALLKFNSIWTLIWHKNLKKKFMKNSREFSLLFYRVEIPVNCGDPNWFMKKFSRMQIEFGRKACIWKNIYFMLFMLVECCKLL